jgi:hypothetical protein
MLKDDAVKLDQYSPGGPGNIECQRLVVRDARKRFG